MAVEVEDALPMDGAKAVEEVNADARRMEEIVNFMFLFVKFVDVL